MGAGFMDDRAAADPWPSEADWSFLAIDPQNRRRLEDDLYFREAWADLKSAAPTFDGNRIKEMALLAFKPDAVVGRRMSATLGHLCERGFRAIASAPFLFNRHSMRELWRYDWTVYPVDRLAFSTWWYLAAPSLLVIAHDDAPEPGLSASERLSRFKGSAFPGLRTADSLRSLLVPSNRVLNFVHVAESGGDLVRELGVLLPRSARRQLLNGLSREVQEGGQRDAEVLIAGLEAAHAEHDLDFTASILRLQAGQPENEQRIAEVAEARRRNEMLSWDELCERICPHDPRTGRWDFICVASHVIPLDRDGAPGEPLA
jgi:hypothetical protein